MITENDIEEQPCDEAIGVNVGKITRRPTSEEYAQFHKSEFRKKLHELMTQNGIAILEWDCPLITPSAWQRIREACLSATDIISHNVLSQYLRDHVDEIQAMLDKQTIEKAGIRKGDIERFLHTKRPGDIVDVSRFLTACHRAGSNVPHMIQDSLPAYPIQWNKGRVVFLDNRNYLHRKKTVTDNEATGVFHIDIAPNNALAFTVTENGVLVRS